MELHSKQSFYPVVCKQSTLCGGISVTHFPASKKYLHFYNRKLKIYTVIATYICKGCKEIGKVSTLVPARYRFDSRIGRANLVCKFRSKIMTTIKTDVFY